MSFTLSPTLAANEQTQARIAAGHPVVHLAFGEAGLPVHPLLLALLAKSGAENRYAPVAGTVEARRAAAGYLERRGLPTDPDLVVMAPGSKALLFAVLQAVPGDVVLPTPSWVSYEAQAAIVGRGVIRVGIPRECGGIPDPDALREALASARRAGRRPAVLILTVPDNPTGTIASRALLQRVCAVAAEAELLVVSDEIYRDLAFDANVVSPATFYPEGTVVTAGLSKNLALGGWRIGFARLPHTAAGRQLRDAVVGIASEIWSCLATPMQAVAAAALDEPEELRAHVASSRRLHGTIAQAVHAIFVEAGATCREPQAAFYLYPDLEPLRARIEGMGASTGMALGDLLLERFDIAVLAGPAFGDDPKALRFRASTSLLYGDSAERRWEALAAADPLALPWIADALARIRAALAQIGGRDAASVGRAGVR